MFAEKLWPFPTMTDLHHGHWTSGSGALLQQTETVLWKTDWTTFVVNLNPFKIYETHPKYSDQSVSWHYWSDEGSIKNTITQRKWRIDRQFSHYWAICIFFLAWDIFFCGLSAQNSSVREMMICDSNYLKKVDTCKGAANWNQYTGAFITNRQQINTLRALQLTFLSFTQLPASGQTVVFCIIQRPLVSQGKGK